MKRQLSKEEYEENLRRLDWSEEDIKTALRSAWGRGAPWRHKP